MAVIEPDEEIAVESVRPGDTVDDNTRGVQPGDFADQ